MKSTILRKFTLLRTPGSYFIIAPSLCVLAYIAMGLWPGLALAQIGIEQPARTVGLQIKSIEVRAELADTPALQQRGLMFRRSLQKNHGMVFVFAKAERYCMWMKNTPLPLSVAFINAHGRIVNIEEMEPLSETSHCAKQPVAYALEMERGWFRQNGVTPGELLRGLP
jgi:uncharacterized membrane protein (UPF0127 family)